MEARSSSQSTLNPPVFFGSAILIIALVLYSTLARDQAQSLFGHIQDWIIVNASWFYVLTVALILITVVFLAISRFGDIKLGPDHSRPDYRNGTWFAMLFSAGMGIGLMFFGVAEPVMHYLSPPVGEGGSAFAASEAMKITFFHWGLHAWAIYAIVALILAYFGYRHDLPLTLRSALYPLIGERIYGPIGHAVDIFAVLGTVLGVATSLGFGVAQINGDDEITGFEEKPPSEHWINGGFFAFEPGALSYLTESSVLEREPLAGLASDRQLRAYRHTGFWDCMDTYKDAVLLNDLWERGDAPWRTPAS